ncbi:type 1 glutamine amidotransferase domain-containing protein [Umezawaea tangerina]|uniref:Putative intracellular protease/amidase n=1 Tax=Umezawaea tangerina TaxID=84725 RepID=A0A2T0T2M8_9PSEU|nr:type 1 glutamine amidotransferase domain-containing protein [Umezawaea tangerina]PRY39906.1 putative intracellular protease/amidase [Umezawaea tangerina]
MAKVLFVMTGVDYWTLKDGTRHPTGYWAEEFVAPYVALTGAGHEITVATPGAVVPTVDQASLTPDMAGGEEIAKELGAVIDSAIELAMPVELKDVRLADYAAVYYPGGHGPMEDLAVDADSGRLLVEALASGKPLAVVCHAPAALLATRDENGTSPFAGYQVTGFTNDEEAATGLAPKAKWLLEDELAKLGVRFSRGESWAPYTVVDRNLYTGQNPASAAKLAKELLAVLE